MIFETNYWAQNFYLKQARLNLNKEALYKQRIIDEFIYSLSWKHLKENILDLSRTF